MIQRPGRLRLTLKSRQTIVIRDEIVGKNFDGDITSDANVTRAINLPHAARPDQRDDLIAAEVRAGGEGHGLWIRIAAAGVCEVKNLFVARRGSAWWAGAGIS